MTIDDVEVARYEDLRSCANRAAWSVSLQLRRLRTRDDEVVERDFPQRFIADAEVLVMSLYRLLSVALRVDVMTNGLQRPAIDECSWLVPNLKDARNVIAHLDLYLGGDGRNKGVRVGDLGTTTLDEKHLVFAGFNIDLIAVEEASNKLFEAIRLGAPDSYERARAAQQAVAADGAGSGLS